MRGYFRGSVQIAGIALTIGVVTIGIGLSRGTAETATRDLKPVAAFQSIADETERSRALFTEAAKVITDPRCSNCHPATRLPTQGDDMHPHVPFLDATESGIGAPGLACSTCHRAENTTIVGSRLGSIPGNAHWMLAPASMAWQGLDLKGICAQLKDLERNGNRDLAAIHKHMMEDHLVAWAWDPGAGRRPAPGSQEVFGELVAAWIETGAACPL
ncbi:hypothetical protein [Dongia sp.]|uniref:hypothetical protein n=1 Tax=Dongia sp. TaxID=1977262 RepID=UPI0035B24A75